MFCSLIVNDYLVVVSLNTIIPRPLIPLLLQGTLILSGGTIEELSVEQRLLELRRRRSSISTRSSVFSCIGVCPLKRDAQGSLAAPPMCTWLRLLVGALAPYDPSDTRDR